MFLENFIDRFLSLEAEPVFLLAKTDDMMSFRINDNAMSVLKDLQDLLNTLLAEQDVAFVVSLNMITKSLDLKVEGEC